MIRRICSRHIPDTSSNYTKNTQCVYLFRLTVCTMDGKLYNVSKQTKEYGYMLKKTVLILMALLVALVPAFSMGIREIEDNESIVKVIAVTDEGDGVVRYDCVRNDGFEVIYRANEDTKADRGLMYYTEGSILAIKDNGIATRSLPPQMWAEEIRDISLACAMGIYDGTIEEPMQGMTRTVEILEVTAEENGIYRFDVVDENGEELIYRAWEDTIADKALDLYLPGSIVSITDDGIATMSLPPQMRAVEIITLQEPAEIEAGIMPIMSDIDFDDMIARFSYTIGYQHAAFLNANPSALPNAAYLVRGILDLEKFDQEILLLTTDQMVEAFDGYNTSFVVLGNPGNIGEALSLDEINALPVPETDEEKYSYSYGYILASNALWQFGDVNFPSFITAIWDGLYNLPARMTEEDMLASVDEYNAYLQEVYIQMMEQLAVTNLKDADEFFAENAKNEDIVIVNDAVQLQFNNRNTEESAQVQPGDDVKLNYTLRTLDGMVLDQGSEVVFPMDTNQMIAGFVEGTCAMNVGDSATVYVHPTHGYGEYAPQPIEPNKLLVFDIDVIEIVK